MEQVEHAISRSGYPLQTALSELLREDFQVLPEWGYRDRFSDQLRTLDMLAIHGLYPDDVASQPRTRPSLALLIECKRSDLPYVFFAEPAYRSHKYEFPRISGLESNDITITTDGDLPTWTYTVAYALGLSEAEFITNVGSCSTFSKCVRKGPDLELSGSEPYQGIVLPLMSAMEYFQQVSTPTHHPHYFDAYLAMAVAVIDGPMTSYDIKNSILESVSWCRVFRNEPGPDSPVHAHLGALSMIDIVHRQYFQTYLLEHLLPFAKLFAGAVMRHDVELAEGRAFVSGYGFENLANLERRMQPVARFHRPRRRWSRGRR